MLVVSSDDPYGSLDYAVTLAQGWGSELVEAGACRHINGNSGLGEWPVGRAVLSAFEAHLG